MTPTSSKSQPLEIQSDIPKIDIPLIKAIPEDGDIDEEEDIVLSNADDDDDENTEETCTDQRIMKRGLGRPRKIKTGRRGRPSKYCIAEANCSQEAFLAEIPIDQAITSPHSHEDKI